MIIKKYFLYSILLWPFSYSNQIYVFQPLVMRNETINNGIASSLQNIIFTSPSLYLENTCFLNNDQYFNSTYDNNDITFFSPSLIINGLSEYQIGNYMLALTNNNQLCMVDHSFLRASDDTYDTVYVTAIGTINNDNLKINNDNQENLTIGTSKNTNLYFLADAFITEGSIETVSGGPLPITSKIYSNYPFTCNGNLSLTNDLITPILTITNQNAIFNNRLLTHNITISGNTTITNTSTDNNNKKITIAFTNNTFDINNQKVTLNGIENATIDSNNYFCGILNDNSLTYFEIKDANNFNALDTTLLFEAAENIIIGTPDDGSHTYILNCNANSFIFNNSVISVDAQTSFIIPDGFITSPNNTIMSISANTITISNIGSVSTMVALENNCQTILNDTTTSNSTIFSNYPLLLYSPPVVEPNDNLDNYYFIAIDENNNVGIINNDSNIRKLVKKNDILTKKIQKIKSSNDNIQKKIKKLNNLTTETEKIIERIKSTKTIK